MFNFLSFNDYKSIEMCAVKETISVQNGRFIGGPTFSMPLRRAPERPAGSELPSRGLLRYERLKKKHSNLVLCLVDRPSQCH
jgi:hypothetical protein